MKKKEIALSHISAFKQGMFDIGRAVDNINNDDISLTLTNVYLNLYWGKFSPELLVWVIFNLPIPPHMKQEIFNEGEIQEGQQRLIVNIFVEAFTQMEDELVSRVSIDELIKI